MVAPEFARNQPPPRGGRRSDHGRLTAQDPREDGHIDIATGQDHAGPLPVIILLLLAERGERRGACAFRGIVGIGKESAHRLGDLIFRD